MREFGGWSLEEPRSWPRSLLGGLGGLGGAAGRAGAGARGAEAAQDGTGGGEGTEQAPFINTVTLPIYEAAHHSLIE